MSDALTLLRRPPASQELLAKGYLEPLNEAHLVIHSHLCCAHSPGSAGKIMWNRPEKKKKGKSLTQQRLAGDGSRIDVGSGAASGKHRLSSLIAFEQQALWDVFALRHQGPRLREAALAPSRSLDVNPEPAAPPSSRRHSVRRTQSQEFTDNK